MVYFCPINHTVLNHFLQAMSLQASAVMRMCMYSAQCSRRLSRQAGPPLAWRVSAHLRLAPRLLSTVRPCFVPICLHMFRTSAKQFAAGRSRLAFEVDSNVAQDVIVYTYKNDRLYRLLTIFGIVQFFFWLNLAGFCYSDLPKVSARQQSQGVGDDNIWMRIITAMEQYKYRIAVVCLALGTYT